MDEKTLNKAKFEVSCRNCELNKMRILLDENGAVEAIEKYCMAVKSRPKKMELGEVHQNCLKFKIKKMLEWQVKAGLIEL